MQPAFQKRQKFVRIFMKEIFIQTVKDCWQDSGLDGENGNGGAFRGFSEIFSPPQNGEFFKSQKGGKFIFSKNSPRVSLKAMQSFSPDPMYLKQNVHNFPDVIRMCGFAFENLRSDKLPAGSDFSTAAALFSATDRNARESFSRYSRFLLPREFFPILSSCELALT